MFAARASQPVKPEFPAWGIFILESHHGSAFRMSDTAHDFFKIMFVLDGAGGIVAGKARHPIHKGDVIAVPAGFRHRIEDDPRRALALIVLCIRDSVMDSARDAREPLAHFRVLRQHALTREARGLLRQLFFEQSLQRESCATMMTGIALQLLATLARTQSSSTKREPQNPKVETSPEVRVLAYVKELDQKFSDNEKIDNVAERLGLSRRYFTRVFRKLSGASWLNHVRALRIRHAKALLRKTERSVAIIGFECGFEDLSSFYRAFKAETGMPPQQWRERRHAK